MELPNRNVDIKPTTPLVSGAYFRTSTGRQEQEETIDSQIDEVKMRIEADGNILPSENIFIDDGFTGEMLRRPALDAMRDAAATGSFQVLYVYDRGRLSRVFAYQEVIIEELADEEIQFVTLHDVAAETPEEKVLQAMQGVFHQYERIKIVERMRRGKMFKAKLGILINGSAVYGYNYVKKTETEPAHYEINEEEARAVSLIFKWVGVDGLSLKEVIRKLYNLGIPPRKKKSEFWTKGPIVRLLRRDTYAKGIAYYNKSEAIVSKHTIKNDKYKKVKRNSRRARDKSEWIPLKVPTIIDDDGTFEKIQQILNDNQTYAPKNRKYDYLLTGKTFCQCGNRRVGDGYSKGSNHYYRCAERIYKFPMEAKCKAQGVNAVVLDGLFWRELRNKLDNPKVLRNQAERWIKTQATRSSIYIKEIEKLKAELNRIKEEKMRYAKAYGSGSLDFEQFKDLMKEQKNKEASYLKQIEELEIQNVQEVDDVQLDELCEEASQVIKDYDFGDRGQTVKELIDKVIIKEGGWVDVVGHILLATHKMAYEPIGRNCGFAECWQIDAF